MARRRRHPAKTGSRVSASSPASREHSDYRHLPERPDPACWVTSEEVTPPNSGPRRFAINDDMWLIERFIGLA
jgi:hypothetical protein